jgi:nitrate reductase / nitrite oxidoreductase, beta subunit
MVNTREGAMDVRAQISTVFHLDKCLGCHTCSVACKNVWTDRAGADYMWWNNVETKPGTGYPTCWEDQNAYAGGWERHGEGVRLKSTGKASIVANIFHNPHMPTLDDYYEPWTYDYEKLFDSAECGDQPVARPISLVTRKPIEVEAGPNWDDDLAGSPVYARNDPNLATLDENERRQMFAIERLMMFYVPRTCNHCLNPACVAACPSGALYKRGEDGVVLIDQNRCRAWRACVPACPYKKTYFNWVAGKSEKCILCFPRIESGQAPACFHSCVGRIRYVGVLLYDAARIAETAAVHDARLIDAHRSIILDPRDADVASEARRCGVSDATIEAAQASPVYRFVKEWRLALPLHAEFRTLPTLFYVPPLSPVVAAARGAAFENADTPFFDSDAARLPVRFLASMFGAGDEGPVRYALRKQQAVRAYRRAVTVGDLDGASADRILERADCTAAEADAIYRLTALCRASDRFALPPGRRESAMEPDGDVQDRKGTAGFGFVAPSGTRSR